MPKIVMISDTHQLHEQVTIPEGDILIHCGDFTNKGSEGALTKFLEWFSSQPHEYKVFIAGNHELGLDKGPTRPTKQEIIKSFVDKDTNMFYLDNSGCTINGISLYGSANTPFFFDWAFNVVRGVEIASVWNKIPDDTNILITHGPPYGILDLVQQSYGRDAHQGCSDLLERIKHLSDLKLHAFGHLHYQGGQTVVKDGVTFVNAAICDDNYKTTHSPVVVDI